MVDKAKWAQIGYCYATLGLFLACGIILVTSSGKIDQFSYQPTSYVLQIQQDWSALPFVDVSVHDGDFCPNGTSTVYERVWYGEKLACDCLNVDRCSSKQHFCNMVNWDYSCNRTQENLGCQTIGAQPAIRQPIIESKLICGQQGGEPFRTAKRPSIAGDCPDGYQPCSQNTSPEATICTQDLSDCPITDIKAVLTTEADTWTNQGYSLVTFNETTSIVFSKNANNLPITSTALQDEPCMDSLMQSNSPDQFFYVAEIMQSGCVTEKNTGLLYDPRFTTTGLYTDLATVYSQNGVLDLLLGQPNYGDTGPSQSEMESFKLQGWNRPTIGWSLECDAQDGKSREDGYEAAGTDLYIDVDAQQLEFCGYVMIIFGGGFILYIGYSTVKGTYEDGISSAVICTRISVPITLIIVAVNIFNQRSQNDDNLAKLDNYEIINECADEYTYVNTEQISSELETVQDHQTLIVVLFSVCIGILAFECVMVCGILVGCCPCLVKLREKKDESTEAKSVAYNSEVKEELDPEASYLRKMQQKQNAQKEESLLNNNQNPQDYGYQLPASNTQADYTAYQPQYGNPGLAQPQLNQVQQPAYAEAKQTKKDKDTDSSSD